MHKTYEVYGDGEGFSGSIDGTPLDLIQANMEHTYNILHRATETTTDDLGWRSFASQAVVAQLRDRVKELEEQLGL